MDRDAESSGSGADGAPIHELPSGLEFVRTTPEFDEASVPAGLLRAHRVADDTWGRLVVRSGSVRFVFEDRPDQPTLATPDRAVVIPPGRPHHVEVIGPVRFAVEFHRLAGPR